MPAASGSLAFLGAARFQGYWDANGNNASGSGLDGQKVITGRLQAQVHTMLMVIILGLLMTGAYILDPPAALEIGLS